MGYWALQAQVGTEFNNFFPANHEDTRLYRQFQNQYGGAQTMVLLMRLKHGDIFNSKMLHKIQDITFDDQRPARRQSQRDLLAGFVAQRVCACGARRD